MGVVRAACPIPPGGGASTVPSGLEPLIHIRFFVGHCLEFTRWPKMVLLLPRAAGILILHPRRCGRRLLSQGHPVCL